MYIYRHPPIDYWGNAIVADDDETATILAKMPEAPRWNIVFKTYVPYVGEMIPVYMCKADNNGTVYVFCEYNFTNYMMDNMYRMIKEDK